MKFLCPQCKAKYQISDDKVAGKSVRMKCRKCAFLIELRASVADAVAADEQTLAMGPDEASAYRANALRGSVPPGPVPLRSGHNAAAASPAPVGVAPQRAGTAPNRPLGSPSNYPAPQRHTAPEPRSTLFTGQAGSATGPLNVQTAPKSLAPKSPGMGGGALASAFARNFDAPATDVDQAGRHVEWYCAIGGAPVGPLSAAELQQKVASGNADAASLVWRDGLEEWQPLRQVGELAAVLRDGNAERTAADASAISAAAARVSMRAPAPKDAAGARMSGSPPSAFVLRNAAALQAGADASQQLGAAGFGASSLAGIGYGAAQRVDANGRELAADPFLAGVGGGSVAFGNSGAAANTASAFAAPNYPNGAATVGSHALGNAQSMSHTASSTAGLQMATASVPPARKRGVPWGPLAMLAAALAFGATGAIVVFYKKPPPPVITIVETQVTAPGVAPDVPSSAPSNSSGATVLAPITATGTPQQHSSSGAIAANTPSAKATASSGAVDLKSLIGGGTGPASDPHGPGSSSGGGGSLTSEDMQRTVAGLAPGVKRRCWDGAAATGSVNVTVNGTVGGDGHVQSASASGNDPAVAKCIENAVRGWKFPATGGTSTFSIPFKFVRQ